MEPSSQTALEINLRFYALGSKLKTPWDYDQDKDPEFSIDRFHHEWQGDRGLMEGSQIYSDQTGIN